VAQDIKHDIKIVGLGASAGGMQPLKEFFEAMPADKDLAFVVIQHLDPQHESHMAAILARYTKMKVSQAEDNLLVEPNCVYTIPPNKFLSLKDGTLHLTEPTKSAGLRMPIDFFFRSLAQEQHEKAVAVLFSGSGSDGTLGIREIHGEGGLVMVQEPTTAEFTPMLENAIATGLVDGVLPVPQIPAVILNYMQQSPSQDLPEPEVLEDGLRPILDLLASENKNDFHSYKKTTLQRRIQRRMGLQQIVSLADYLRFLRENPDELEKLSRDMLIGVTSFFRDPSAFEELREKVVIPLVQEKNTNDPMRVWVAGCATGEEAYSIVILLMEEMAQARKNFPLQVFASDLDTEALKCGRQAIYPESVGADLSEERLARCFNKIDHAYQVNKQVRGVVTFTLHNLLGNPPFLKMDLISCRNLLMYIEPEGQKKIFNLFGFALNPGGYLFLGKSDTTAEKGLFEPVSRSFRIFRRNSSVRTHIASFPTASRIAAGLSTGPQKPSPIRLPELNQQVLLKYFNASIVLIDENGEILHFYGPTQQYLVHPGGNANLKLFEMLENKHSLKFRSAVEKAAREYSTVRLGTIQFGGDGSTRLANVTVMPLLEPQSARKLLAVIFEEAQVPVGAFPGSTEKSEMRQGSSAIAQLEADVGRLKEQLQDATETFQTTHEELTAANEEVLAINEELQSTNEELETSKEELQSVNEEIVTANNQLNDKLEELNKINNDLANFLNSSEGGTIFLDTQFCIRRFTPSATTLLNVIPLDVGRPVQHISNNFVGVDLLTIADRVLTSLAQVEQEVETAGGRWYLMRCLPYRTLDNVIDGVVFTFSEITGLKRSEAAINEAREYAENIIRTTRDSFVVLDPEFKVVSANRAFYETFEVSPGETENCSIYELGSGQWNVPKLRELLEEILPENTYFENFEVEHEFPKIGRKIMALNARKIQSQILDQGSLILLAIEDVTARRQAESEIKQLNESLEARVRQQVGFARLLHIIANAANAATSIEQVLRLAIDDVCNYLGWPVGHAYIVEEFGGKLVSTKIWHLKDPEASAVFRTTSEAFSFSPGIGLPGSVMVERKPRWIDNVMDDPNFLRAAQAETAGIRSGLAVPVFAKGKIAAVLEFFTSEAASASDALLEVMEQIGIELGQVFERKWAETKLRESERLSALGITTAAIIHEIANPLQLISGLTDLLRRQLSTEEEKKEAVELVADLNSEIDHLTSLLTELRFASSPGLTKLNLEPTNLPLFAVECLMKDKLPSAYPGIRLEHDLPADLPLVMIDRNKMKQVLLNLYKNAVEAMPDGGTLSVRGFQSKDRLCLDIADTGSGIPKDMNVFEPSVTTKPHGMGLGLMVVQQIISAHQGSITYTSQLAQGTVFRISLPLAVS
jgi:two-component system, chemotaxis family, CheB/CheR fusion protein